MPSNPESEELGQLSFHSDHPQFVFEAIPELETWIVSCIDAYESELGTLNIIAVSDETLHAMNIEFLQHDTLTDIITFDDCDGSVIGGELYISWDRVQDNALIHNTQELDELHRVIIHGVLHLLGLGDKSPEEATAMRAAENKWLSLRNA